MNQPNDQLQLIFQDGRVRREIARENHYLFFHMYFSHYIKHKTAEFQKEMFSLTDSDATQVVIVAFRGSAKSTIMALSYPIWAALGKQHKKFIILLSQTQDQAHLILRNIRREFESNELLIRDFGPFITPESEWRNDSLYLPQTDTRIMALSMGENIRGLRHGQYRPDLIICDDVEDLQSVRIAENRDKNYQWYVGDVIPAGSLDTKIIVIGNLLHQDSLIMRLKDSISHSPESGVFRAYPVLDSQNRPLWPGRYPDQQTIDYERKRVDYRSWQREYCLVILPDEDCVVHPDWIHYYDDAESLRLPDYRHTAFGVDLAISQKSSADYTAIVAADAYGECGERVYVIRPYPVNNRLSFPQTIEEIKKIHSAEVERGNVPMIYIEKVAYQDSVSQQLSHQGFKVNPVEIRGDKRERLSLTTELIKSGKILFPRKGAESLIQQLLGFSVEKHDDLADAFSMLVTQEMPANKESPPLLMAFFDAHGHGSSYSFRNGKSEVKYY